MSQIQLDIDLEKKIYRIIDDKLIELKRKVYDHEYTIEWDRWISTIDGNYYVKIEISIITKFMEISEYCSSNIEELEIEEKELEEKEIEELYNECMENLLDEINSDYALRNIMSLISDKYEIKSYPIYCDSDYCKVGGGIEIVIKSIDIADIQRLMYYLEDILTLFIEL
ncbi:MAG: hypothetical protein QXN51_05155 [Ignisphaera sp.]